jgi:hypothetical protein
MIDEVPTLKQHHHSKFTSQQVREIRAKLAAGVMGKIIMIDYGISRDTLSNLKFNRTYKGIV